MAASRHEWRIFDKVSRFVHSPCDWSEKKEEQEAKEKSATTG
jgi:hypothetical protein